MTLDLGLSPSLQHEGHTTVKVLASMLELFVVDLFMTHVFGS